MVRLPALPLALNAPLQATPVPPSQSAPHAGCSPKVAVCSVVWSLDGSRYGCCPPRSGHCSAARGLAAYRACVPPPQVAKTAGWTRGLRPRLPLFLTVQFMDRPMVVGYAAHPGFDMRLNDTLASHLPATVRRGSFRIASLAGSAWSAPPTAASIEALLAVTKSEALVEKTSAELERNMQDAISASLQGRQPTEREQQIIQQMTRESAALIRQELSWATMRPMMVQIYQSTFTQEEVDGQTAFYRTPVGATVVEKMPAVMQATMAVTQQSLARLMPQLQAIAQKHLAQAKAANTESAAAAPNKP